MTGNPPVLFRTIKQAAEYVGGLSEPEKMPGFGYGIPAKECKTGGKLRKVEGSVCSICYALKGNYVFKNVQDAQYRRLKAMDKPYWIPAMALILNTKYKNYLKMKKAGRAVNDCRYFRALDSGDLQSYKHLLMWVSLAKAVPRVKFWIPTREVGIVSQYLRDGHTVPKNMVIRVSAAMIGKRPPVNTFKDVPGIQFSAVSFEGEDVETCKAYTRDGHCGSCRSCWKPQGHKIISYPKH